MLEMSVRASGRIDAAFSLESGFHAVVGSSGAGKTSLFRALSGMDRDPSFHGAWQGQRFDSLPSHLRPIAYVPQRPSLIPHRTVEQQVRWVASSSPQVPGWKDWTEVLQLQSLLHRYPPRLSGGEQQRAALLRALAAAKPILLLDEALSKSDRPHRMAIYRHLGSTRRSDHLIVFSTHQWDEAQAFADALVYVQAGQVRWSGPVAQALPIDAAMATMMGYIATIAVTGAHLLVHPDALAVGSWPDQGVVIGGQGVHCPLTPTSSHYRFSVLSDRQALEWIGEFGGPSRQFSALTIKNPTPVSYVLPSSLEVGP